MPKAIYFDCFSGISGDMALGALLDAGLPLDALRAELAKLNVGGWAIDAERGMRRYIAGTRARVHAPEQPTHRHLSDVRAIIVGSALALPVQERSLHIFTLLAEAEGQIHGIPAEQVHFHEVGALDAIVDIVGVVAGLALLGVEQVYASPLPLGSGWTRAAHGQLPLPAPAVLALLAGVGAPTIPDDAPIELVTPTGAALLAGLATFRRPPMRVARIGYGLGMRDPERPNALRVWLGETIDDRQEIRDWGLEIKSSPTANRQSLISNLQSPILLETNIDDQPAEQLAYAVERLFELGALDAWLAPIQMKKGRAGTLLAALVPAELEDAAVALIMRETTTLGLRRRAVERHVCEREIVTVETPLGPVRVKRKRWRGEDLGAAPEYEDCARLARAHGLPLREVYQIVLEQVSE
jgi:pyridinium-3,5-bisthiocarboxylic acid mononucleotide nickel chelatase